ncbi:MAG: DUF4255 domain-containing protein [Oscillospiraceae bacterium]|jgi:hypothetical protein|nr:DUF4255 domain-containing protein [Oscillospiraceae bacterium]
MFSQIDAALVNILSAALADVIPAKGRAGVCSLKEPGDINLGLCLYGVNSCPEVSAPPVTPKGRSVQLLTPRFLTLRYLLAAFGKADAPFRAGEEHRLLNRAMRAFDENQTLKESELGFEPEWTDGINLWFEDLSFAEISNIWEKQGAHYRLSAAYRVFPVELRRISGSVNARIGRADFSGVRK